MPIAAPESVHAGLPDPLGSGSPRPFRICLNTSTLRGHGLSLPEIVDVAAAAGYDSIEPWIDELERHEAEGGNLADVASRLRDLGLGVESAIGFFDWINPDPNVRRTGIDDARRAMDKVTAIGGKAIAAPPWGMHQPEAEKVPLDAAAERYQELLDATHGTGVVPLLELWGFSRNLSRLGEVLYVASECPHPNSALLLDIYHLYKGGSPIEGLRLAAGSRIGLFHVNDYPNRSRELIADADRVYPGDGVAPLSDTIRILSENGFRGALSLELFNERYWKQPALEVARTGRTKVEGGVERALGWQ